MKKIWLLTFPILTCLLFTGCTSNRQDLQLENECISWENCEIQESVTQEVEPDSIVIYWWTWNHEIIGDRTIYYNDKYGITFRVWKDFSWWIIQEWDINENYNWDYYNAHYIQIQIRNDDVPEMYKKDWKWYSPNFWIVVYENEQFGKRDLYSRFWDPEYYKIMWQNDKYIFVQTPKDVKYTDLRIFNVDNIEKNWEDDCIYGVNDWLKNMEPNWVFSEIVRNNDNWEYSFKIDWMNMKTKSWVLYYTNNNTKRKLDFQCRAEVEAARTSTSFWNVEFVG